MGVEKFGRALAWLCRLGGWLLAAMLAVCGCGFPSYTFHDSSAPPDGCSGSECGAVTACPAGSANCNGKDDDGCEVTLGTLSDCDACGSECANSHGPTICQAGTGDAGAACQPTCIAGYADCDLNPNNGCETDINSDSINCGSCGKACSANGGTPLCVGGKCGVSSCNPGFGDCTNGGSCNIDLNTDPFNCGHCGHICSNAHGAPFCNGGSCQITCDAGYGDCNAPSDGDSSAPDDGCETTLNVPDSVGSVPNCGACGAGCTRRAFTTVSLEQCAQGVCARDCIKGEGDCDNNRNDPQCLGSSCGCETLLAGNGADCGACGHACLGGACSNSVCQCPDTKPNSGSTKCTLSASVVCGAYPTSCHCTCKSGLFQCTDASGKAC
jgi:hypothetical protein